MPILKVNILGVNIKINYQEGEKNKLNTLIDNFLKRLSKFENLKSKVTDNKILILSALKAEDEVLELNKKIKILEEQNQKTLDAFDAINNKISLIINKINKKHENKK